MERRLVLIYLGSSHYLARVHATVIRHLEGAGPGAGELAVLRATAEPSRDALYAGDLAGLGRAMIRYTEAQRTGEDACPGRRDRLPMRT